MGFGGGWRLCSDNRKWLKRCAVHSFASSEVDGCSASSGLVVVWVAMGVAALVDRMWRCYGLLCFLTFFCRFRVCFVVFVFVPFPRRSLYPLFFGEFAYLAEFSFLVAGFGSNRCLPFIDCLILLAVWQGFWWWQCFPGRWLRVFGWWFWGVVCLLSRSAHSVSLSISITWASDNVVDLLATKFHSNIAALAYLHSLLSLVDAKMVVDMLPFGLSLSSSKISIFRLARVSACYCIDGVCSSSGGAAVRDFVAYVLLFLFMYFYFYGIGTSTRRL